MNIEIETVVDSERGCGWRKEGGLYLRASGVMVPCGKLPVPLDVCPCCHAGIKPARGWTWINPRPLLEGRQCTFEPDGADSRCKFCPMHDPPPRVGLLWVGEKFYPTPDAWLDEARRLGVSRRIPRVPEGFMLGQDYAYVAHRKAIITAKIADPNCPICEGKGTTTPHSSLCECAADYKAAIFHAFKPERIEYVTKGTETELELDALRKRGITPVKVVRDVDLPEKGQP